MVNFARRYASKGTEGSTFKMNWRLAIAFVALALLGLLVSARYVSVRSTADRASSPKHARLSMTNNRPLAAQQETALARGSDSGDKALRDTWDQQFSLASDKFQFTARAAKAALAGDGRAAIYVSKAVGQCAVVKTLYSASLEPDASFAAQWGAKTNLPDWFLLKARKQFDECSGFLKGDPFATLPARQGGYDSIKYWNDLAYQNGDPLAQAFRVSSELEATASASSASAKSSAQARAQNDINRVIASSDPSALIQLAQILMDGRFTNTPVNGAALALVACNLGYDCSSANSAVPQLSCAISGACAADASFPETLRGVIGNEAYAKAYARAQQLEDAMRTGNIAAAQDLVQLSFAH